ncbi:MAG: hypothetical protein M3371_13930 [Acidobacteriota bacterium]|nr:hypothetical protein [Acidobacteriota bacterium]
MSCNGFETNVLELARGELMDATTRAGALRHVESCAACAARLADEQSLTNSFRAVIADDAEQTATARVETVLLAALREREFQQTPLLAPPRVERFWSRRMTATAALVVASVALVVLVAARFERQPAQVAGSKQAISETKPATATVRSETPSATPQQIEITVVPEKRNKLPRSQKAQSKRLARETQLPVRFNETMTVSIAGETSSPTLEQSGDNANEVEGLTDFVSLNGDNRTSPVESGQLVRVQLNRASLASLGLPMNAERAGETVKAEVLLSEDGIARAIRLIR